MERYPTMKRTALLALALLCAAPAAAKDPIVVIENGVRTPYGREGIIDFAKDYEKNPRILTLEVLGHPFHFTPNANGCGAACTSLNFVSPELGVNRTFTGNSTAEVSAKFQEFVKSDEFLKPFMRLINSGAGAQLTGSPSSAVGSVVQMTFRDSFFERIRTAEEKANPTAPGRDPSFSAGFARFSNDGFGGSVISVAPGFTLNFGEHKDQHLKVNIPMAQVSLEGLRTYRTGVVTQYLIPFFPAEGWTITLGPGISYLMSFSLDLPQFSGLMGGGLSSTVQRDWDHYFATGAGYYGRFNNLGGIDTDIQANIYGWGGQAGRRFGRRWVSYLQLVSMHERVAGFPINTYHTAGVAVSYKILDKFNLTLSTNKVFGLPNQRFADFGMGSAWFF